MTPFIVLNIPPGLGTPAARMLDQVPEEVKDERLARLNEKAWKHAAERYRSASREDRRSFGGRPGGQDARRLLRQEPSKPDGGLSGARISGGDVVKVRIDSHKIANLYGKVAETVMRRR